VPGADFSAAKKFARLSSFVPPSAKSSWTFENSLIKLEGSEWTFLSFIATTSNIPFESLRVTFFPVAS